MIAKLGELHQPLHPRLVRNPCVAWGSTCLDRPCEQGPNAALEIVMLHRGKLEMTLVRFGILWKHPSKRWDPTGNLLGLE
jgi:hypothetical protein